MKQDRFNGETYWWIVVIGGLLGAAEAGPEGLFVGAFFALIWFVIQVIGFVKDCIRIRGVDPKPEAQPIRNERVNRHEPPQTNVKQNSLSQRHVDVMQMGVMMANLEAEEMLRKRRERRKKRN